MHETRTEKEVEMFATNLADKTKYMSTNVFSSLQKPSNSEGLPYLWTLWRVLIANSNDICENSQNYI
jgi:hypothetical protein